MDKIKAIPGKVKEAVVNQVAKASIKPIQEPQDLFQKMFDNIVWVIVLVGVLFLLIMAFMSTQTFFSNRKINQIQKDFPTRSQLKPLDFRSESGTEEEIDEIDVEKHKLSDVQICSSSKSYLLGRQLLDYGSQEMVIQTLKMGAKFIELDVFENRKYQLVVTNGLRSGNWKLTFNQILLADILSRMANLLFNPDVMNNFNDPIILFLNLNIPKARMEEVAQIIQQNFSSFLLAEKFSISGDTNILDVPLQELLGKLIIMTSGAIGDTSLDKLVHLRLGDRLKKVYFNELTRFDKKEMIQFNKHHLTLVHPPLGFRSINYNPEAAFDYGCQIVCMFFQRADDFLQEYLSHFANKSFRIKPFEFTRFHDIPQNGYDPDKIAYYNTYMDTQGKNDGVLAARSFLDNVPTTSEMGCCEVNLDDSMFDLDILKEKLPETPGPNVSGECSKITGKGITDIDYQFNTIRLKLQKLNVAEHEDIVDIERLNMNDNIRLQTYIDRHIFLKETKCLIQNKLDLIYFILTKQLKKALSQERSKLFTTDFEDKCVSLDSVRCHEEPICYFNRDLESSKCRTKMDNIPFPKYCLPKYEVENRNLCVDDSDYSPDGPSISTESKIIKNKSIRGMYHQTMSEHYLFGRWSGPEGIFEIEENQNAQCEFKFVTPVDEKEFTMYLTDNDGDNILIDNFEKQNITGIRAKGTFVDRKLREIEDRLNLPRLPFHGYADIKIIEDSGILDTLTPTISECLPNTQDPMKSNTDVLLGIYQYTDSVVNDEKDRYKKKLSSKDKKYLLNQSSKEYTTSDDIKTYHYKMIMPECNLQLQKLFGREPRAYIAAAEANDDYFDKSNLPPVDSSLLVG